MLEIFRFECRVQGRSPQFSPGILLLASVPLAATHEPARRAPPYGSTPDHGPNGFRVRTRKLYADVEGRDTETALDQYLDVGAPCP